MASLTTTLDRLTSETALVEQASAGVHLAFDELHRRHAPAVWAYASAVSGDTALAGAAVADGFAMVFTAVNAGRIEPDVPFRQYVLMATRNSIVDRMASTPVRNERSGDPVVASAFARIPERWRSVLWLRVVEGLRLGAAAAVVKLPAEQVAQLATRASGGVSEQYLRLHSRLHPGTSCTRALPRLVAFVAGTLDAADGEALTRHLAVCDRCGTRHETLRTFDAHLADLAVPMPADQRYRSVAAWSAAVVPAPTGMGLGPGAEKVLAVVSASAAAVAVFGAALQWGPSGTADTSAALGPIVGQMSSPVALELPAGIRLDGAPVSDIGDASSGTRADDGFGAGARRTAPAPSTPGAPADEGTNSESGSPTPDTSTPTDGTGEAPAPGNPAAPPTASPDPSIGVGTDVGDTPVAVEIGPDPGLRIGPISIGSAPSPSNDLLTVEGPLAPLQPVVAPVNAILGGLLG